MPATTPTTHPAIVEQARVVHNPYGRGTVTSVDRKHGYAGVRFEGESADRHVPLSRLVVQPADMPAGLAEPMLFVRAPYRVVWPLDSTEREAGRQRIADAMAGRGE